MSIFEGIKNISINNEKFFITPGDYEIGIVCVKHVISQKKPGQEFFIVEGVVNKSTGDQAQPAGTFISWVCNLTGPAKDKALEDCKKFTIHATGADPHEVDAAFMEALLTNEGADLADAGAVVVCHAWEKITQKGNPYFVVEWGNDGSSMSAAERNYREKTAGIPF